SSVAPGTYPVTITGTSGGQTQSETVNVIVTAPPFVLSASPKVHSVLVGEPAVWTVSSTPLGSFNGTVTLSIDLSPLRRSRTPAPAAAPPRSPAPAPRP